MAVETPPVIQPAPPRPDRSDPDSFPELADGWTRWERDHMMPGVEALADNVVHNANETITAVNAAMAAGLANAATNAASAAADRTQTGLDRVATGQDRTQTGLDRAAVAAALDSIAGGPMASVNGKPGPTPVLIPTDIAPAATPAEMAAGTETDYRSISPALVANAITAKTAVTGDLLITARNPGAGWLDGGTVYLQSAYMGLFSQLGLISDVTLGTVFTKRGPVISDTIKQVIKFDGDILFARGTTQILKSVDAGLNWSVVYVLTASSNLQMMDIIRVNATTILAVGYRGGSSTPSLRTWRSNDSGSTWVETSYAAAGGADRFFASACRVTDSIVILSTNDNYLWRSSNGGASFSQSENINTNTFVGKVVHRISDTVVYAFAANGSSFYKSTDAGATWASSGPNPLAPTSGQLAVGAFAFDENIVFIWTGAYLCVTFNAGTSWVATSWKPYANPAATNILVAVASIDKLNSTEIIIGLFDTAIVVKPADRFYILGPGDATMRYPLLTVLSPVDVLAIPRDVQQLYRTTAYSYDEKTQFKTPFITGLNGAKTYIKAA